MAKSAEFQKYFLNKNNYSVIKNVSISISILCIGRKSIWTHTAFLITLFLIFFLLIMILNVIKGVLSFKVLLKKHTYFLKHEGLNLLFNEHTHE